jgi:hypothetical protein
LRTKEQESCLNLHGHDDDDDDDGGGGGGGGGGDDDDDEFIEKLLHISRFIK